MFLKIRSEMKGDFLLLIESTLGLFPFLLGIDGSKPLARCFPPVFFFTLRKLFFAKVPSARVPGDIPSLSHRLPRSVVNQQKLPLFSRKGLRRE
jgi:hypothetical protein